MFPSKLKAQNLCLMSFSFTPCIPNTGLSLCSVFPNTCFSDEDPKTESSSENKQCDESQAQTQDQLQQQSSQPEASSDSNLFSGCGTLRKPEQPDFADRSSQSSFTSQDGTGKLDEKATHTLEKVHLC